MNYNSKVKSAFSGWKTGQVVCQKDEEAGDIYISNGYLVYKMTDAEYSAFLQPLFKHEAGEWDARNGGFWPKKKEVLDVKKYFQDCVNKADADQCDIHRFPGEFRLKSRRRRSDTNVAAYYSAEARTVRLLDTRFISGIVCGAIPDPVYFEASSCSKQIDTPVIFLGENRLPIAIVLPIQQYEYGKIVDAVKAYFYTPIEKRAVDRTLEELRRSSAADIA